MKFSILFRSPDAARRAQQELTSSGLLHWDDVTSIHDREIRVDKLPLTHTSARSGALLGGVVVGVISALVLAGVATINETGFSPVAAVAFGLAIGALYGGVFGAIAYSTRPAAFIRRQRERLVQGAALLVCEIEDPTRAARVQDRLNNVPGALPT